MLHKYKGTDAPDTRSEFRELTKQITALIQVIANALVAQIDIKEAPTSLHMGASNKSSKG